MINPLLVSLTLATMLPVSLSVAQEKTTQTALEQCPEISLEGLPEVWLQGDPIKSWEKDHVYVFEFWATWCGPCLAAMPHMEELHQAFKASGRVHIVGINVSDRKSPEQLKEFLSKRPKKVTYPIAVDVKDARSSAKWLNPLKVQGIPFVMAVKNGRLIWKGHPVRLSEALINEMLKADLNPVKLNESPDEAYKKTREKFIRMQTHLRSLYEKDGVGAVVAYLATIDKEDEGFPKKFFYDLYSIPFECYFKEAKYAEAQSYLATVLDTPLMKYDDFLRASRDIQRVAEVAKDKLNADIAWKCLDLCYRAALNEKVSVVPVLKQKALLAEILGNVEEAKRFVVDAFGHLSVGRNWDRLIKEAGEPQSLCSILNKLAVSYKAPEPRTQLAIGETMEDEVISPIFKKMHWMNSTSLAGLPKKGVVILDFWRARQAGEILKPFDCLPGRASELALKKYNLDKDPNIRIIVMNVFGVGEEGLKSLSATHAGTSYPVGSCPDGGVFDLCAKNYKIKYFPACAVFRDGVLLWTGETRHLPSWVAEEMAARDFNAADCQKRLADREARKKTLLEVMKQSFQFKKHKQYEENEVFLREKLKEFPNELWLVDQLAMIEYSKHFKNKEYQKAVDALEAVLIAFPTEYSTASYYVKVLQNMTELQPYSYQAIRRAMQIMHDRNTRDNGVYNYECYAVMAEMALAKKDYAQAKQDLVQAISEHPLLEILARLEKK